MRTRLDDVAARERDVEDREATLKTDTAALERQKIDQENILAVRAAAIEKQKVDQETALATRAITLTRRGMDRENALAARTRELERHEIDTGIELAARERAVAYHERVLGPMPEMPHEPDANYVSKSLLHLRLSHRYRTTNSTNLVCPVPQRSMVGRLTTTLRDGCGQRVLFNLRVLLQFVRLIEEPSNGPIIQREF